MTHNQEVKIQTGALTEGTRHQGDKGIDLEPGHAENSGLHGLLLKPDGSLEGGADSRREGIVKMLPPTH